ncbi:adapter protein MecA 1/2 [Desulfonispora thiosulfatigenes DSM 11270]|uniref:Adapter protein MecA 1/2 n=1 Tax=Desulfonispora thiosulfatigenes DSM 11270 TaxID=656914 RepID=A0A1W1UQ22_DESTI|nr:adaptor protein MecA [Desulfonispora thiosulfatigenes]SMB83202.1 adapter protein MecA 1/2 [Desulfonispora thiosulfatigenes DSM 11270]
MKFKRINEDKIQIIISSEDLERKQVKKWDLMPNSPRAQELFQEMLEQAYNECGFEVDSDTQLMVEAYPMTSESLVVIVTKLKQKQKRHTNKEKNLLFRTADEMMEDIEQFEDYMSDLDESEEEDLSPYLSKDLVYAFASFENAVQLSKTMTSDFEGVSSLYKFKNSYYLVFKIAEQVSEYQRVRIGEYGQSKIYDSSFLDEHGELLIKDNAINVLGSL